MMSTTNNRPLIAAAGIAAMLIVSGCGGGPAKPPASAGPVSGNEENKSTVPSNTTAQGSPTPAPSDDPQAVAKLEAAGVQLERDAMGQVSAATFNAESTNDLLPLLLRLPFLRHVSLSDAKKINDEGLAVFADLKQLVSVDLSWTSINGSGLAHLAKADALESLDISYTDVADEHLLALKGLKHLRHINVEMTAITQQGREALRAENNELAFNVSPAPAVDPYAKPNKPGPNADTPQGKFDAIVAEREKAIRQVQRALNDAQTREAQQAVIESFAGDTPFARQVLDLVDSVPDDSVVVPALAWVLQSSGKGELEEYKDQAVDKLIAAHLNDPRMRESIEGLDASLSLSAQRLLAALAEKSDDLPTRIQAKMGLAMAWKRRAEIAMQVQKFSDDQLASVKSGLGEAVTESLLKDDTAVLNKRTEEALDAIVAMADGVEGMESIIESVTSQLFALRNLAIGATAPEIEGRDIDGNELKLSDFRGRVVVLDFWGHW
jgi:hypothetical protein